MTHLFPKKYTHLVVVGEVLCVVLLIGIPSILLGKLALQGPGSLLEHLPSADAAQAPGPGSSALFAALGFAAFAPAASLWALWHISRLFACFRKGLVISPIATKHVTRIGQALLLQALATLLAFPIITGLLTLHNNEGQRMIAVSLSSNELWSIVSGVMLIAIGVAFSKAVEIDRENRSFV